MDRLKEILSIAKSEGASDVHIVCDSQPIMRVNREIMLMYYDVLSSQDVKDLIYSCLSQHQIERFEREQKLCASVHFPEVGFARITVYYHRGRVEASIRLSSEEIKSLRELGLPPIVEELANLPSGLILITGASGQGKTTTLNAMINHINENRRCKIVTVEDPIEYIHKNKKSIIVQQEVPIDIPSFSSAIPHILRQDPDVICVGEMRDLETISSTLTAAETGHLVIASIHTIDVTSTVDRIIDIFPPSQQEQTRLQLINTLKAVISQRLLPRADHKGLVLACEILVSTEAVRNVIREKKVHLLENIIRTSSKQGMVHFDDSLKELYLNGLISHEVAVANAKNPKVFGSL